jgi:guanine deaminase
LETLELIKCRRVGAIFSVGFRLVSRYSDEKFGECVLNLYFSAKSKLSMKHEDWMQAAIDLSINGVTRGEGGPFGAVVVKDGKIVGRGNNKVTTSNDPTAHAEVVAIRDACKNLGTFQLSGCIVYTSCEPCPMCLGAIYWARPDQVFFACTKTDAAAAGFDDQFIYDEIELDFGARKIPFEQVGQSAALEAFRLWDAKTDRIDY